MSAKNATITKEQAKEELLRIATLLGKTPTRNDFLTHRELKGCHKQGLTLLFGSNAYTELLRYSGLDINITEKQAPVETECASCHIHFLKAASQIKKSINHFCSKSCSATYNNRFKLKSGGKYVVREKVCLNCSSTYHKDGRDTTNTCSQICMMELGMKQRLMKDAIKRRRS